MVSVRSVLDTSVSLEAAAERVEIRLREFFR
jgi:hypothetical protein